MNLTAIWDSLTAAPVNSPNGPDAATQAKIDGLIAQAHAANMAGDFVTAKALTADAAALIAANPVDTTAGAAVISTVDNMLASGPAKAVENAGGAIAAKAQSALGWVGINVGLPAALLVTAVAGAWIYSKVKK